MQGDAYSEIFWGWDSRPLHGTRFGSPRRALSQSVQHRALALSLTALAPIQSGFQNFLSMAKFVHLCGDRFETSRCREPDGRLPSRFVR